jgi:type I restriction enzyme, R subunit
MGSHIDKSDRTEAEIRTLYITPAIKAAGWDFATQVREEFYLTDGRIVVRGRLHTRGKRKFCDYVLCHKPNIPIAIVEAKDNTHGVGAGMQQALEYADMLDVPFVFSSNGDGFIFHDKTAADGQVEKELTLDEFPSPEELWNRWAAFKGLTRETAEVVTQDYYTDGSGRAPRYYQLQAINRTVEAVARGQNRILLVMATGTGKTMTAFQIIWRLWKSGTKKRILFLADRNILVDQTMRQDFKPFGTAMTKVTNRTVDKSYEIFLSLYQAVTGTEEDKNVYKQFSRDFFDLIVIDECHRGSAADDSAWREILEYFSGATQIGLTATPKETREVSNITYFGHPVYEYSLRQGIEDGFLAPYKVVRIDLDRDLEGWRPTRGQVDKYGNEIEDRIYNQRDFDRGLVLEQRTELVAQKITEFLRGTDRNSKTIVFCENIDHAERMRTALVNANSDITATDNRYVMQITGDNPEGKAELDNFIDAESSRPVIAVTSKLMTTGVDSKTCKLVVLDQTIRSMTEFKQIIGRGTRINEEYGKHYFTIMDFRRATELFADPAFDGDPVVIYEPRGDDSVVPPDEAEATTAPSPEQADSAWITGDDEPNERREPGVGGPSRGRRTRYVVGDVRVLVLAERVQFMDRDGRLITESLKDYTKKTVHKEYSTFRKFLDAWRAPERRENIVAQLAEEGVFFEALSEEVGKDYSPFDLVCHVAFDQPPLTRQERARNVRKRNYFTKYGDKARKVLEALLDKYADEGLEKIEDVKILRLDPLAQMGTTMEIVQAFGGKPQYVEAVRELERALYSSGDSEPPSGDMAPKSSRLA